MAVIESQSIGVLFATPPALLALAEAMTHEQRSRIRGVHYGGLAVESAVLERLQLQAFPEAVHLSGYGNTLLGCCLELRSNLGRALEYYPLGDRLIFRTLNENAHLAPQGRVSVTRLDETFLIVDLLERDHAQLIDPPAAAPDGFTRPGLRHPHTPVTPSRRAAVATLY